MVWNTLHWDSIFLCTYKCWELLLMIMVYRCAAFNGTLQKTDFKKTWQRDIFKSRLSGKNLRAVSFVILSDSFCHSYFVTFAKMHCATDRLWLDWRYFATNRDLYSPILLQVVTNPENEHCSSLDTSTK